MYNWAHKSGNNESLEKDSKDCKINSIKNVSIPCTNPVECISQNLLQVALAFGKYSTQNEICMINKGYSKELYNRIFE